MREIMRERKTHTKRHKRRFLKVGNLSMRFGIVQMRLDQHALLLLLTFSGKETGGSILMREQAKVREMHA